MFNNLIESSSHVREIKRRGSFMLFTAVTYCLLFVVAGVMSIYAYDASLEEPSDEIVVMLPPLDMATTQPAAPVRSAAIPRGSSNNTNIPVRQNPMASVNVPQVVPETASAHPNPEIPVPDSGIWHRGGHNSDPGIAAGPGGNERGTGNPTNPPVAIDVEPPLPEPAPKPVARVISKGVITSQALALPKPAYPPIAKQARVQGVVSVQVLIDESGKVVSSKTISGNPLLAGAAQQAAYGARFSPARLGDQAVKVSGVITYNFVLN
jgi:protein TonB